MVSDTFYARWRSGRHVGNAKPTQRVLVRRGEFNRRYMDWDGPTVNAEIWGESRARPWGATWEPQDEWVEIPNVLSINLEQDFSQRGMTVATVVIENVLMREASGAFGLLYHHIERGGLSPSRGYRPPGSPFAGLPGANEWRDVLVENAQVFIWQGYGDAMEPTFVGMIDKVDPTSVPARITLSARDGKVLSDSRCLGWNLPKQIREPIIFQPQKNNEKKVGAGAECSTERVGHPPRFVVDGDGDTSWLSHDHTTEGNTEWVSIRLPQGRYTEFWLDTAYPGQEIYVGLNLKDRKLQTTGDITTLGPPLRDGVETDEGWVEAGLGDVPGGHGGWPYIRKFTSHASGPVRHKLGGEFEVGDNTLLRIGVRHLKKVGAERYRAGISSVLGVKLPSRVRPVKGTKVIRVADMADIVRCVLRWAGFKDWKVDDTGVELEGKMSFNRGHFYMDVIDQVAEATGYNFSMLPPLDEASLGVPCFKETSVRNPSRSGLRTITDQDLLTDIKPNFSDESKAYIIRVRGRGSKKGRMLGYEHERRIMDVYRPPWVLSGNHGARIIKHVTHEDPKIKDVVTLKVFSRMWALQMALEGATATAEIPGTAEFLLDDQLWLKDNTTGLATRLWVSRRSTTATYGKAATWKMSLGGSLIDTEDVVNVMRDLHAAEKSGGRKR